MDTNLAEFWIASHQQGWSFVGEANEQAYYERATLSTAGIDALAALGRRVLAALHMRTAGRAAASHDFASSH